MIKSCQRETWRCKVRVIMNDWNDGNMIFLGPKGLLTWKTFICQQFECYIGVSVSIGILPGNVQRNSMKTNPKGP